MRNILRSPLTTLFALVAASSFGQFGPQHAIDAEGAVSVRAADVDSDSDMDLVIGSRGALAWVENTDGNGTMDTPVMISAMETFIHVDDLNADGEPDIIGSVELNGGIRWYANQTGGAFSAADTISSTSSAKHITTGDMDNDGDPDLVFALENGSIAWAANTDGLGDFGALQLIAMGQNADHVQAVDLNNDFLDDLMWSNSMYGAVSYAINTGGGAMGPVQTEAMGFQGRAGDVDGDGVPDLISYVSSTTSICWQRNLGGSFSATVQVIATGVAFPTDMLAADLNGDGSVDLAITERFPDQMVWYANADGLGDFGEAQPVATGLNAPRSLVSADLDGDGDPELACASLGQQQYVWSENLSLASFTIAGRVFNDRDADEVFDDSDHGLLGIPVRLSDGRICYTNASGMYSFVATAGAYTVTVNSMPGWDWSTPDSVVNVTLVGDGTPSLGNDFGLSADGNIPELIPSLTTAGRKCNYEIYYWLTVVNSGNQVGDATLSLTLDPLNDFVFADPAPDAVNGNTYTWDLHELPPSHWRQIDVRVQVPSEEHIGETVRDTLVSELYQALTLVHTGSHVEEHLLTCAFDPNDKQVSPVGDTQQHLVATGQRLTYTIRFQNTGTAPAEDVVVLDTLDQVLDLSTIELLGTSHPMQASIIQDRVLQFAFMGINLPDSVANEPASHGFITFSIAPIAGLPNLTIADNAADIYFELNAPVRTNTVFNTFSDAMVGVPTIDPSPSVSGVTVWPNPMTSESTVKFSDATGTHRLLLTDARGQLARSWIATGGAARIDRLGLPAGLYHLSVVPVNGAVAPRTVRLVIE